MDQNPLSCYTFNESKRNIFALVAEANKESKKAQGTNAKLYFQPNQEI